MTVRAQTPFGVGYTKCYHFEIAASLLDEESFAILRQFPKGKIRLEIGLQSTNEHTLAAISRHQSAEKTLAAARRLKESGNLHVHLDLIAGLPFEDYFSFAKSFDAAYPHCDVLQLGFLKLLYGTALQRDAQKYGILASATPPYTVLSTKWLTFEEIDRLKGIADLLDRLCEKGRFSRSLGYLMPLISSPFSFFEGFLDYLLNEDGRDLQKISQRDLFSHVAAFAKRLLPADRHEALLECLRADFSACEVRRAPTF